MGRRRREEPSGRERLGSSRAGFFAFCQIVFANFQSHMSTAQKRTSDVQITCGRDIGEVCEPKGGGGGRRTPDGQVATFVRLPGSSFGSLVHSTRRATVFSYSTKPGTSIISATSGATNSMYRSSGAMND